MKLFFTFAITILSTCIDARACKCIPLNFEDESNNADVIFRGTVMKKTDNISTGQVNYTFKLNHIWKGNNFFFITITTDNTSCGDRFMIDSEYVVYAVNFHTNRCRRNSLVSFSQDIKKLNAKFKADN